jgi:hypothetical protein
MAKTSNRSVVGTMNKFALLAEGYREGLETPDVQALSVRLRDSPCTAIKHNSPATDQRTPWFLCALDLMWLRSGAVDVLAREAPFLRSSMVRGQVGETSNARLCMRVRGIQSAVRGERGSRC